MILIRIHKGGWVFNGNVAEFSIDKYSNVNIKELITFHEKYRKTATVTAVQPPGRFGSLVLDKQFVTSFQEKPLGDGGWVNGGFLF